VRRREKRVLFSHNNVEIQLLGMLDIEQAVRVGAPESLISVFIDGFPMQWRKQVARVYKEISDIKEDSYVQRHCIATHLYLSYSNVMVNNRDEFDNKSTRISTSQTKVCPLNLSNSLIEILIVLFL